MAMDYYPAALQDLIVVEKEITKAIEHFNSAANKLEYVLSNRQMRALGMPIMRSPPPLNNVMLASNTTNTSSIFDEQFEEQVQSPLRAGSPPPAIYPLRGVSPPPAISPLRGVSPPRAFSPPPRGVSPPRAFSPRNIIPQLFPSGASPPLIPRPPPLSPTRFSPVRALELRPWSPGIADISAESYVSMGSTYSPYVARRQAPVGLQDMSEPCSYQTVGGSYNPVSASMAQRQAAVGINNISPPSSYQSVGGSVGVPRAMTPPRGVSPPRISPQRPRPPSPIFDANLSNSSDYDVVELNDPALRPLINEALDDAVVCDENVCVNYGDMRTPVIPRRGRPPSSLPIGVPPRDPRYPRNCQ